MDNIRASRLAGNDGGAQAIAVIGMSGRFPGAANVEQFWANLRNGVESIQHLSERELLDAGTPPELVHDPNYVPAAAVLSDIDLFDAEYFGIVPREAEFMDPQHRILLELSVEALENAGCDSFRFDGRIGMFAGVGISSYLLSQGAIQPLLHHSPSALAASLHGNDKDHAVTRVAYKLGFRGPCLTVQTACSTSLVAVHLACQSLLNGEADLCLAGGAFIRTPQTGYLYEPNSICSSDGHCRPFDARANGTIFGSGAGLVVLKRLTEAVAGRDHILAVILGSAMNNDGATRAGYTAPGVDGQAEVIAEALAVAGVRPESVSYVETHGTATALGDAIEMQALREAFRDVPDSHSCAIGSVKSNVGHLNTAAGVAGLIKTVQALVHQEIPASLHFNEPNPNLELDHSPFHVNTATRPWKSSGPRRAGVSSFGIGGTNVHVVLEEAPPLHRGIARQSHIFPFSARTLSALRTTVEQHLRYWQSQPDVPPEDIACTLQCGRRQFDWRYVATGSDRDSLQDEMSQLLEAAVLPNQISGPPRIAFLFPGQGTAYPGMGTEIYRAEPIFCERLDEGLRIASRYLGSELRSLIYPEDTSSAEALAALNETAYVQPALFIFECALAALLQHWGIQPDVMIGHSLGEYVAASLAGVMRFEDAVAVVCARGRLMGSQPRGTMLAVQAAEDAIKPLLSPGLAIAAINAPSSCVVSGATAEVEELEQRLSAADIANRRLRTSHALHSPMIDSVLAPFAQAVASVPLNPPSIPYLSNVTGNWINSAECTSPEYWARHIRNAVRFADGIRLLAEPGTLLIEVGPGRTLTSLARQNVPGCDAVYTIPGSPSLSDAAELCRAVGHLWLHGVAIDWQASQAATPGLRAPLPTYPFERKRYWLTAQTDPEAVRPAGAPAGGSYERPAIAEAYAGPRNELEHEIAEIWQEVLGIQNVGIHDDFLALGGHSLMVTQIMSRLQQKFHTEIPIERVFENPTIATLAEVISDELLNRLKKLEDEQAALLSTASESATGSK